MAAAVLVYPLFCTIQEAPPEYIAKVPGLNGYQESNAECLVAVTKLDAYIRQINLEAYLVSRKHLLASLSCFVRFQLLTSMLHLSRTCYWTSASSCLKLWAAAGSTSSRVHSGFALRTLDSSSFARESRINSSKLV